MRRILRQLRIFTRCASATGGVLVAGNLVLACKIGRSGIRALKREGDGATPRGSLRLVNLLRRPRRLRFAPTALPWRLIRPDDGWCEVPADRNYNRLVRLPYPASHERLLREDGLYDAIVVLDHNRMPRRRYGGSAIFLHLWRDDGGPTQGCVAVSPASMRKLLAICGPSTRLKIG
jgi:L,D-peptidoglycan transpeptidase YkuD (ErfK/YbiS/YcfS/YnhG family)